METSQPPDSNREPKILPDGFSLFVLGGKIVPVSSGESDFLRPLNELRRQYRQFGHENVRPWYINGRGLQLFVRETAFDRETEQEGARVLAELEALRQKGTKPTEPGRDE